MENRGGTSCGVGLNSGMRLYLNAVELPVSGSVRKTTADGFKKERKKT